MKRIDIHIHFCSAPRLEELLRFCKAAELDRAGLVSLPDPVRGNFNAEITEAIRLAPERFTGFGCLDHRLDRTESGGAKQVKQLKDDGFTGLKLWTGKPAAEQIFGVRLEDDYITGALKAATDLGMPVLIHLADPPDFWENDHPAKAEFPANCGPFSDWIDRGRQLFSKHPDLTFVGAHLIFLAGSLKTLDSILGEHSNLHLDTAPGRWFFRPLAEDRETSAGFFRKWKDRLLLGSDSMFFPDDFTLFKHTGISENLVTLNRIVNFISNGGEIDDPYPWKDYKPEMNHRLPCLNLDEETISGILYGNAERILKSTAQ